MMRPRIVFAGGAIALAAGALAIAGLSWIQAPPSAVPSKGAAATAEVTRGNLRDTKTLSGTLSYGELSELRPSLAAASAMVTWLAPVGSIVERGGPLYTLDGQPTVLFYGTIPQHRTLRFEPDAVAPVWVELEAAKTVAEAAALTLSLEQERLADAEARVADANARLADALSSTPVMPQFAQLAGAVRAAQDKLDRVRKLSAAELTPTGDVAAAEAGLATARAGLDASIRALRRDLSTAGLDVVTERVAIAQAKVKLDDLQSALDQLVARASDDADVAQLAENLAALGYQGTLGEQVRAWQRASGLPVTGVVGPSQLVIADGPVHIAAHTASVGGALSASSPDHGSVLSYSSTQKLVSVPLGVGDQALAAPGRAVTVTLPDDSRVDGMISEVGSVVSDGTIEVTIIIADQSVLSGLEVASVDVEFVSDSRNDVLSVPVAALLAHPEGGFAVEVVSGAASAVMPVHTGLFAAGRVEITGEGIAEGMRVGVPG